MFGLYLRLAIEAAKLVLAIVAPLIVFLRAEDDTRLFVGGVWLVMTFYLLIMLVISPPHYQEVRYYPTEMIGLYRLKGIRLIAQSILLLGGTVWILYVPNPWQGIYADPVVMILLAGASSVGVLSFWGGYDIIRETRRSK